MAFRGCIVGVDRYADRSISELASAVPDAEALHATPPPWVPGVARRNSMDGTISP